MESDGTAGDGDLGEKSCQGGWEGRNLYLPGLPVVPCLVPVH